RSAGPLRWLGAALTGLLPTPPTPAQITKGLSLWLDEKRGSRHTPSDHFGTDGDRLFFAAGPFINPARVRREIRLISRRVVFGGLGNRRPFGEPHRSVIRKAVQRFIITKPESVPSWVHRLAAKAG
ncbi:MAG: hypothetical protein J0M36_02840, partial [Caulobacterales bacterium]|nr:hypothetical protein [Caulobacterales bacterium]